MALDNEFSEEAGIQMLGNKWISACAGMTTVGGSLGLVADAKLG